MATARTPSTPESSARTVDLGTSATIADAQELHGRIAPLLDGDAEVTIDGGQLERIDTAVLQLLTAFVRDAHARGFPVRWIGPSEPARRTIELLGMSAVLGLSSDGQTRATSAQTERTSR